MSIIIAQSHSLRLEALFIRVKVVEQENIISRRSKGGWINLTVGNAPNTEVYTTRTIIRCRSMETGRFVPMSEWVVEDENDEAITEDQDWYPSYSELVSPEDAIIAKIDDDYVSFEGCYKMMSLSELEEWVNFHEQWELNENLHKASTPIEDSEYTITYEEPKYTDKVPVRDRVHKDVSTLAPSQLDIPSTLKSINFYRVRRGLPPITSLKELN